MLVAIMDLVIVWLVGGVGCYTVLEHATAIPVRHRRWVAVYGVGILTSLVMGLVLWARLPEVFGS